MERSFGVLRRRDFRLLWIGETTSGLGSSVTTVALPLIAVVVLRVDSSAVGLLAAAVWLPWLVVGLPAGAWVDRMRKRPLMIACNVLSAVMYASVPLAAWLGVLILGAALAARVGRRFGTARAMLLMQLCTGPFALLLPMTTRGRDLLFFAVGAFTVSAGIVACNVVLAGFRQSYCPPQLLGRVVATTMVLNQGTIPIASLLAGLLGDLIGLRPTMWITTGILAPCWLILALSPMGSRRDLPVATERELVAQ